MHNFPLYFGKELYMFQTNLLSIVRSLNTVFTATGICHTSYGDCLLARSGWNWSSILTTLRKALQLGHGRRKAVRKCPETTYPHLLQMQQK